MASQDEKTGSSHHQDWAETVSRALSGTPFDQVSWVAKTGSTNTDLLEAATRGAPPHGTVLVADHQDAGRGRRDRSWIAAPGDALLVSILLRPEVEATGLSVLTSAVAVSAAEACASLGYAGVQVKWPNDLVVGEPGDHRKLAGILAQSQVLGREVVVVVGMGLNVISERFGDLADVAVALDELGPVCDRPQLLIELLTRLASTLETITSDGGADLWSRYRSVSATLGTVVRAELDEPPRRSDGLTQVDTTRVQMGADPNLNANTVTGTAVDISATGALIVDTGTDRVELFVADVVSVRPG